MASKRLIFSQNEWIEVELPLGHDPNWTEQDTYYYGVIWALACRKGFTTQKARELAEAAVSKRVYPGIIFNTRIEHDLISLEE